MDNHKAAYFIGSLIFASIWFLFFLLRRDLRREILTLSILAGIMGPVSEHFYLKDYWHPQYWLPSSLRIEDFLAGFFLGGISAVGYEVVWRKRHSCACNLSNTWVLVLAAAVGISSMLFLFHGLKLNSIYASIISFMVVFSILIRFRRDLLPVGLGSGLVLATIMFLFYQIYRTIFPGIIEHWWQLENISGVLIVGVPIEEVLWGFSWGMVAGPLYEFAAKTRV